MSQQPPGDGKTAILIAVIGGTATVIAAFIGGFFLLQANKPEPTPTPIPTTFVTFAPTSNPTPNIQATVDVQATQTAAAQTPQYTLQTLCNATERADYQTQWNQFDLTFAQGNWNNESEYASDLMNRDTSHKGVASCTVTNVTQNGSSASGTTTTTFIDGTTDTVVFSLTKEAGGGWKITGLQHQ